MDKKMMLLFVLGFLVGLWAWGVVSGAPQVIVQVHDTLGAIVLALLRGTLQLLILLFEGLAGLLREALARLPPP